MPALSEYTNVYPTALHVLREKGYQVWFDAETNLYWAERGGWDFASESPCGLLGVVAIYEHRQPPRYDEYWWRKDELQLDGVPAQPAPYRSVLSSRVERPKGAR